MEDETSVPSLSSTESDSGASGPRAVAYLLDKLKSPTPSVLARKRAVSANPPPKGKRTCRGSTASASEPKFVNPS